MWFLVMWIYLNSKFEPHHPQHQMQSSWSPPEIQRCSIHNLPAWGHQPSPPLFPSSKRLAVGPEQPSIQYEMRSLHSLYPHDHQILQTHVPSMIHFQHDSLFSLHHPELSHRQCYLSLECGRHSPAATVLLLTAYLTWHLWSVEYWKL